MAAAAALLAAATAAEARGSLAGAYLAGRHANQTGDVAAAADRLGAALAADPANVALMEMALVNMIAAGDLAAALLVAQRLAEADPAHRVANLAIVVDAISTGDFAAARTFLATRPDGVHPLVGRLLDAWAAFGLGDHAAAEAALAGLEDRAVFRIFGRYHLGLMKLARGDAAAAVAAFESAQSETTGAMQRLLLAQGVALEQAGRPDDARAVYERGLASAPADPLLLAARARLDAGTQAATPVTTAADGAAEALLGLAGVLANETGRRLALAYARLGAALRPDLEQAALLVAEIFEAEDRYDLAAEAYAEVPNGSPLRPQADLGRALALQRLDRDAEAEAALRALVAANPGMFEAEIALGDLHRRREAWPEAAGAYSRAIEIGAAAGRESWVTFYQRGIAYERAGEWDRAEADFERALELEPDQPLVLNYLGYSWVELRRNLDAARAMIERAVALRPEDGYITDSLGWVLYRLGDYAGAVEWLEKAVALEPVDPVINDHLGDAYWKVGRRLEAEFQWKRARSFDPEPKDLARIKRKLAVGLDTVLEEEAKSAGADGSVAVSPNGG
jgi:tetratricopeptide (TPR) repeat protein